MKGKSFPGCFLSESKDTAEAEGVAEHLIDGSKLSFEF